MYEFFVNYGADLIALIIGTSAGTVSISSIIKMFKSEKRTLSDITKNRETLEKELNILRDNIKQTKEGIVTAFKEAVIGNDFKISINETIDKKLQIWYTQFIETVKENERLRTQLAIANAKILMKTAAFNKLTTEEQQEIITLINTLGEPVIFEVENIDTENKGE